MPVFTTESLSSLNFVNPVALLLCNNKENTKKRKTLEVEASDLFDSAQVKKSGKSDFNF
jgi:hypothetical protein